MFLGTCPRVPDAWPHVLLPPSLTTTSLMSDPLSRLLASGSWFLTSCSCLLASCSRLMALGLLTHDLMFLTPDLVFMIFFTRVPDAWPLCSLLLYSCSWLQAFCSWLQTSYPLLLALCSWNWPRVPDSRHHVPYFRPGVPGSWLMFLNPDLVFLWFLAFSRRRLVFLIPGLLWPGDSWNLVQFLPFPWHLTSTAVLSLWRPYFRALTSTLSSAL